MKPSPEKGKEKKRLDEGLSLGRKRLRAAAHHMGHRIAVGREGGVGRGPGQRLL